MKTKALLTLLSLLLVLFLAACSSDDGESMDEDYAGTWYGEWMTGDDVKVKITDTSYKAETMVYGSWENSDKGEVEKTGASSLTVTTTSYYDYGWVSCNYTSIGTFYVSEGEGSKSLTLYITYTNAPDASEGSVTLYSSP